MIHRTVAQLRGDAAEQHVAQRLAAAGWTILARNLRLGRDELDLVALDSGPPPEIVIVEVRWRARRGFGLPEETVGPAKRRHLRRALSSLRERLPELAPAHAHRGVRIDLVAMEPGGCGLPPIVRHHRAVEL